MIKLRYAWRLCSDENKMRARKHDFLLRNSKANEKSMFLEEIVENHKTSTERHANITNSFIGILISRTWIGCIDHSPPEKHRQPLSSAWQPFLFEFISSFCSFMHRW